MAKALILLKAIEDDEQALLESVLSFAEETCAEAKNGNSTLRVMAGLEEDPLMNRPSRPFDVTVEIKTRPGQPLLSVIDAWTDLPDRSLASLDAELSIALVMHEKCWRKLPPQPICYHYLMVRRKDFSPADYYDYYLNSHSRFGMSTPGIDRYTQNVIDQQSSSTLSRQLGLDFYEVDSISELQMRDIGTFMGATADTTIGPDSAEDEARFVDRDSSVMFCSSVVLALGHHTTIDKSLFT